MNAVLEVLIDGPSIMNAVLEEMYDLDCALQEYEIQAALRGKLLDAWQHGFRSSSIDTVEST